MALIGHQRRQGGIRFALRFVAPGTTMGQFAAAHNAADGAERGQRAHRHLVELPVDGLVAAEEPLVVETQSHHRDNIFDLRRGAVRAEERVP